MVLIITNIAIIRGKVTGSINCWVSASLSTADPIIAKKEAYSRYPPIKKKRNMPKMRMKLTSPKEANISSRIWGSGSAKGKAEVSSCWLFMISWERTCSVGVFESSGNNTFWTPPIKTTVSKIQSTNCVSPTSPTPIIFPIISWKGLTEETMTSTMRLVFSSITPLITCEPKRNMKK